MLGITDMKESETLPHKKIPSYLAKEDHAWYLALPELPEAPDFVSERTHYSLDKALEFVEEMRVMFPPTERQRELREEHRCTEEFIL